MKRTMVLANVGSFDKPQYQQAEISRITEEGHTEVAFADGQVAVYRSQFHPAGILPVGTDVEQAGLFKKLAFKLSGNAALEKRISEQLKTQRGQMKQWRDTMKQHKFAGTALIQMKAKMKKLQDQIQHNLAALVKLRAKKR